MHLPNSTEAANRAVIYSNPGTLKTEIVDLPIPKPGHGEILVRLLFSGVCHTDIGFCMNLFPNLPIPTPKGQVGGHEGVGEVVAHGPGVDSPAIGTHVGIKYAANACLSCENCIQGGESSCVNAKISGYFTPGTFQQYVLAPCHYATPIPPSLDLPSAAPLMCGGVTVYTALKTAGIRPGDWVVVPGAGGGLGHLAIQYAKKMGGRVVAIDGKGKGALCRGLGADEFLDFSAFACDDDWLGREVKRCTGGGAKIALMCTASSKAYSQATSWLRFRGTIACLGIPEREGCFAPSVLDMVGNELRIIGTKTGNRVDMNECLEIARSGGIKTRYELRSMESLTEVFEELEGGRIQGRVVLDLR